ncbi:P27 family phage terminase small subunit [Erysipelothrix sp. HDW6B]|nr:P27 family phage terminase small subunit [Erysipelothrix sp. HDW6B]
MPTETKNSNNKEKSGKTNPSKIGKKAEETQKRLSIKEDLIYQLEDSGRLQSFYTNLIEDYLFYYDLKERFRRDIENRGLIVTVTSGNGFPKKQTNESVKELRETSKMMLKILQDLKLQEPLTGVDKYDESDYT